MCEDALSVDTTHPKWFLLLEVPSVSAFPSLGSSSSLIMFFLASHNRVVFCRTMPCRPCRCWRGCTWKVSAVWEDQAWLSSAPVNQHRKPSKYGRVCVETSKSMYYHCLYNCDAHWRSRVLPPFFFSFPSRSAKYSARITLQDRTSHVLIQSRLADLQLDCCFPLQARRNHLSP